MKQILIFTDHYKGHIIPTFELAHKLKEANFSVSYFGIPAAMDIVSTEGFATHTILEAYFLKEYKQSPHINRENLVQLIIEGALDELINTIKPDLLIFTAHNPLETLIFYFKYKIKTVLFWTYLPKSEFFLNIEQSPYVKMMQDDVLLLIYRHLDLQMQGKLERFVKEQGFHIKQPEDLVVPFSYFEHFIACSKSFLDNGLAHRARETYLGPSVSRNSIFGVDTKEVFHKIGVASHSRQIVFASMGTVLAKSHPGLVFKIFKNLMDAMKDQRLKEYQMVLAVGPLLNLIKKYKYPSNVHLFEWVPQVDILEQSVLAFTPCGFNSVKECIVHQVPMIASPIASDQFENSKKVVSHGLGVAADLTKMKPIEISTLILEVLNNKAILAKISAMSNTFSHDTLNNSGLKRIKEIFRESP